MTYALSPQVFIGFIVDPILIAPLLVSIACIVLAYSRHVRMLRRRRRDALGALGQVLDDKLSQLQRGLSRIPQTGLKAVLDNKIELVDSESYQFSP